MFALLTATMLTLPAHDDTHDHGHSHAAGGEGRWVLRDDLGKLPPETFGSLGELHGATAEDARTGRMYMVFPGVGLGELDADMKQWTIVGGDDLVKLNAISHGSCVFHDGAEARLALASPNGHVLVCDLTGKILGDLTMPQVGPDFTFSDDAVTAYYAGTAGEQVYGEGKGKTFVPTCTAYLDGTLYVTTGYSTGDFVLTAKHVDGQWAWQPLAWGGRGPGDTDFSTAHGILADGKQLLVASRTNGKVYRFDPAGKLLDTLATAARVCNVSKVGGTMYLPMLNKTDDPRYAPIVAYGNGEKTGELVPGRLGAPGFLHIHHAHMHLAADGLFAVVQAWNPGGVQIWQYQR